MRTYEGLSASLTTGPIEVVMETAVAYLISVGITVCGIWIVAGTLAAGSPLAWTLAGLVTVTIGSLSLLEQVKASTVTL
jgi:hypothetical protein